MITQKDRKFYWAPLPGDMAFRLQKPEDSNYEYISSCLVISVKSLLIGVENMIQMGFVAQHYGKSENFRHYSQRHHVCSSLFALGLKGSADKQRWKWIRA